MIVSAGLDIYLQFWAREHGVELLFSQLEREGKSLTGHYLNGDCSGLQKVAVIKAAVDIKSFAAVYAYVDSKDGMAMPGLATHAYYQGVPWKSGKPTVPHSGAFNPCVVGL